MDSSVMEELLAFLGGGDSAGTMVNDWLFSPGADAADASHQQLQLALCGAPSCDVDMALLSPRLEARERDLGDQQDGFDAPHNEEDTRSVSSSSSDVGSYPSGPITEPLAPPPHPAPLSTPQKRRTAKQEIERLRDQVSRLTLQLSSLKTEAGIDLATPVARVPTKDRRDAKGAKEAGSLCLWEKVATRQLAKRRVSERENRMLREAVITHIRRAKRLRHALLKRTTEEKKALAVVSPPQRRLTVKLLAGDDCLFEELASKMDALYASIDDDMERGGVNAAARPNHFCDSKRVGADRWVVSVRNVSVLPFDYERTGRAVWKQHTTAEVSEKPEEVRRQIQFTHTHLLGAVLTINKTTLFRRYVEDERTVLIGRSIIEPAPGIRVDQTMRVIVKPGPPSVAGPTSEVLTYLTGSGAVSIAIQELFASKFNVGGHNLNISAGLWSKAVARAQDNIENMLLVGTY